MLEHGIIKMANHLAASDIVVIGAGPMAREYFNVLDAMGVPYNIVRKSSNKNKDEYENYEPKIFYGGIDKYLKSHPSPKFAIICTPIITLADIARKLVASGVPNILVEKPLFLRSDEIENLTKLTLSRNCKLYIAYNRRFYGSVRRALELIEEDGGLQSIYFDFTEWSDKIAGLAQPDLVKSYWGISNSSHVIDLAFYLGGRAKELNAVTCGGLSWHPASANFAGCGVTDRGVVFSYRANWDSAGRWELCAYSKTLKLIFCPLEKLKVMRRGDVTVTELNDLPSIDETFKPGVFEMVQQFIEGNTVAHCSLLDQINNMKIYNKIFGYDYCELST